MDAAGLERLSGAFNDIQIHQATEGMGVFYSASKALGLEGVHIHKEESFKTGIQVPKFLIFNFESRTYGLHSSPGYHQGSIVSFHRPWRLHRQRNKRKARIGL